MNTSHSGGLAGSTYNANRLYYLSFLAAVIGAAAGGAAYLLIALIAMVSNLVFHHELSFVYRDVYDHHLGSWIILVPAIGGLIIGLMAKYGSSKIRGHGIPEAMEAVLFNRSRIAPQVAILKPISVAVAIGTGGPFGAEGPIIQTGGALGSILGQALHLTSAERKVLLASGAAAGMAATFSTPIAAVILAIELLLFEYKARSFIPLVVSSVLAMTVRFYLMGRGPMFDVGSMDFRIPQSLPYYLLLGIASGLAAVAFTRILYWVEDKFESLPIDQMWWPAIGGLGLGCIGFFVPRVLGVGYGTISDILNDRLTLGFLAILFLAKSAALMVSLGSGTSGGLLAPMFMAGAAMGGLFAALVNHFIPGAALSGPACALLAMAAVFGSAARAPFAFIIFAFELTRNYNAVLPLMLVVVVAYGVSLKFLRHSIMTEKLARRGQFVHQEYEVDVFHQMKVGEIMDKNPHAIIESMTVAELSVRTASGECEFIKHQAFPIIDSKSALRGIITRGDIRKALERPGSKSISVLEAGTLDPHVAYADESIHSVLIRMLEEGYGRLPVVSRENPSQLVGYLGRTAILEARRRKHLEENEREPGWLQALSARKK